MAKTILLILSACFMALVMSRPERELETRLTARDEELRCFPYGCFGKEEKREALAATEEVEKRDEDHGRWAGQEKMALEKREEEHDIGFPHKHYEEGQEKNALEKREEEHEINFPHKHYEGGQEKKALEKREE